MFCVFFIFRLPIYAFCVWHWPPRSCMRGNRRIWNVKNQFRNESSEFWLRNIIFIAEITVADSQYSGCVRRPRVPTSWEVATQKWFTPHFIFPCYNCKFMDKKLNLDIKIIKKHGNCIFRLWRQSNIPHFETIHETNKYFRFSSQIFRDSIWNSYPSE